MARRAGMKLFRKFDSRLAAELRSQRKPIIVGLVCTAVAAVLSTAMIGLSKVAISAIEKLAAPSIVGAPRDSASMTGALLLLFWSCLAVVIVFLARYWFVRGQTYYLSYAANRLAADLRLRMFRKLMRLPIGYFSDKRSGGLQSVLTNDVNVYQNAVGIIRDSIDGPIKAIGGFIAIFWLSWQLGCLSLLLLPPMVVAIQRNARKMRKAQVQVQIDLAEVGAKTQEALQGVRVVKAFGAEASVLGSYSETVEASFDSQMKTVGIVASLRPLVELIGAVGIAVMLYISGLLARQGLLSVSSIAALLIALDTVNQGFRSLGGLGNTYATVQAASERIHREVLDAPEKHEEGGGERLSDPVGQIAFDDVSFTYPDGTEALRNVSFVLEPGTSLALVGPSGAGKSTIADLLLRFYEPASGRITFDGVDIRDLDIAWLRDQIGVVPQQTFLFAGSIEDNIRLGAASASDCDIREALVASHAEEFTREMSQRTTSDLGERGARLSGGQMQRIAIARALVRKPKILLLDEATSALDPTSERIVTEALEQVMHERTTLFIAHRLTTAARADRILVLRRGEIVEEGSHRELMEQGGSYAGLFKAFSGGVLEA